MAADHDSGDENDGDSPPWRTIRILVRRPLVYTPRSWVEEQVRTLPNHDGGDEDAWQPLSELSKRRVLKKLGFY